MDVWQQRLARARNPGPATRTAVAWLAMGLLALLCAAAAWGLAGWFAPVNDQATLGAMQDWLARLDGWLQRLSPALPLGIAALLALIAARGASTLAPRTAPALRRLQPVLTVLLLAACTGAGLQAGLASLRTQVQERHDRLQQQAWQLQELVMREARRQLTLTLAEALAPLQAEAPSWAAFARLVRADPKLLELAFPPDPAQPESAPAPPPAAPVARAPSGIPAGQLRSLLTQAVQAQASQAPRALALQPVAELVVRAALDDSVEAAGTAALSGPALRRQIQAIGNPVLALQASTFLAPGMAPRLQAQRLALAQAAQRAFEGGRAWGEGWLGGIATERQALRAEMAAEVSTVVQRVRELRAARGAEPTRQDNAQWALLRSQLAAETLAPSHLHRAPTRTSLLPPGWGDAEARAMRQAQAQALDLAVLRGHAIPSSNAWQEGDFQAYLQRHPELAALWGHAVFRRFVAPGSEPAPPAATLDAGLAHYLRAVGAAPATAQAIRAAAAARAEGAPPPLRP